MQKETERALSFNNLNTSSHQQCEMLHFRSFYQSEMLKHIQAGGKMARNIQDIIWLFEKQAAEGFYLKKKSTSSYKVYRQEVSYKRYRTYLSVQG